MGRHILTGATLASLTACSQTTDLSEDLGKLRVVSVTVDTSAMEVEGRDLPISREEVAARFKDAIVDTLSDENEPVGIPVDLRVSLTRVHLAPPLHRVVAGTSTAEGTFRVTLAGTNALLRPETEVSGNTTNPRVGGMLGLLTTVTPEQDYRATVLGFALAIRTTLFGYEDSTA